MGEEKKLTTQEPSPAKGEIEEVAPRGRLEGKLTETGSCKHTGRCQGFWKVLRRTTKEQKIGLVTKYLIGGILMQTERIITEKSRHTEERYHFPHGRGLVG